MTDISYKTNCLKSSIIKVKPIYTCNNNSLRGLDLQMCIKSNTKSN